MKQEHFVCDRDECQAITPHLWADIKLDKWLCEECYLIYADITKKTRKKNNATTPVHKYKLGERGWKWASYWFDKTLDK